VKSSSSDPSIDDKNIEEWIKERRDKVSILMPDGKYLPHTKHKHNGKKGDQTG